MSDPRRLLKEFVLSIRDIGKPERVEPVIRKVEAMLKEGSLPVDAEEAIEIINNLTQEALGIDRSSATLTLYLGAD